MVKPPFGSLQSRKHIDKGQLFKGAAMVASLFASTTPLASTAALGSAATLGSIGPDQEIPVFFIDQREGGKNDAHYVDALQTWLAKEGCVVQVQASGASSTPDVIERAGAARYRFETVIMSEGVNSRPHSLSARTFKDIELRATWLVKASRGVDSLSALKGERVALLNPSGAMGYSAAVDMLAEHGVGINDVTVFESGAYQGSMVLLLHGDVFSAAVPLPLARRWAAANGLAIVSQSESVWQGVFTVQGSQVTPNDQQCLNAMENLSWEGRSDPRRKLFPEWVEGFVKP